jgi:hypothetical protein
VPCVLSLVVVRVVADSHPALVDVSTVYHRIKPTMRIGGMVVPGGLLVCGTYAMTGHSCVGW